MNDKPSPLKVDRYNLDDECEKQADEFHIWAEKLAKAREAVANSKNELAMVMADLSIKIRQFPDTFKLTKVTENTVESAIILHPRYQEAKKALIKAEYFEDHYKAMVDAFHHKKSMIEKLCDLDARDYFAEPSPERSKKHERPWKPLPNGKPVKKSKTPKGD
jgi:hypothetical protein